MTAPVPGPHQGVRPGPGAALQRQAEALADVLRASPSPVHRNVFLSLVAGFLADGDAGRFGQLLEILGDERSPSAAHFQRSGSWGEQLRHARNTLTRLLAGTEDDARQLQSLLGWTARILEIRAKFPGSGRRGGPAAGGGGSRGPRRPGGREAAPAEPKPKPPAARLGLGGKSLAALEGLRRRIGNGDDSGEEDT